MGVFSERKVFENHGRPPTFKRVHPQLQLDASKKAGCKRVLTDTAAGARKNARAWPKPCRICASRMGRWFETWIVRAERSKT